MGDIPMSRIVRHNHNRGYQGMCPSKQFSRSIPLGEPPALFWTVVMEFPTRFPSMKDWQFQFSRFYFILNKSFEHFVTIVPHKAVAEVLNINKRILVVAGLYPVVPWLLHACLSSSHSVPVFLLCFCFANFRLCFRFFGSPPCFLQLPSKRMQ